MSRRIGLIVGAVALTAAGCGVGTRASADPKAGGHSNEAPAIERAVRLMLADYIHRDLPAFCSDFTPGVAAHLAGGESGCEPGLARAFAPQAGQEEIYAPDERPDGLKISHVRRHGNTAHLTSTWPWPDIRKTVNLSLQETRGRWLIATPTHVVEESLCSRVLGELDCRTFFGVRFGAHIRSSNRTVEPRRP